ncbi:MAG: S-adenosylmethionine:tRNA ribosyltransferase-isomerase [Bacteroidota bacterium]
MQKPSEISLQNFNYELPGEKIALTPAPNRDASKLLVCKNNSVEHRMFRDIPDYLPSQSLIVFNNTRVINARLLFKKETGAEIEIFLLEPYNHTSEQAFASKKSVVWKCLVGNARKWREVMLEMQMHDFVLQARLLEKKNADFIIEFSWSPEEKTFLEIISHAGNIPLPPYIHRKAEAEDQIRYQTIYAKQEGSVAAPTAGLHFSEKIMQSLQEKEIEEAYLTLHVGAGTFLPVKDDNVTDHTMHTEKFSVSLSFLEKLIQDENNITAVGTTSLRTLESLYWLGVQIADKKQNDANFLVEQWEPYQKESSLTYKEAIEILISYAKENQIEVLHAATRLMIVPGYNVRSANFLVTNFHQPKSTLLLLLAAFAGNIWKDAYRQALEKDYRFLSYGDCCLFEKQS